MEGLSLAQVYSSGGLERSELPWAGLELAGLASVEPGWMVGDKELW